MITPGYALTSSERVLPSLALDFTTAVLDPRITFTRALNTATRINASGIIEPVNADTPRFNYDPVSLQCLGLRVEEQRTNLLLNSLIDGTSLSTQTVTVAAAAHTLSFYGSGEVVLSGTHSATVTGTGAYPNRRAYTFTPTAGSLTLTVTGTVQYANLEAGGFATSFIPTDGTAKLRSADLPQITGANFTPWYNTAQGTIYMRATSVAASDRNWFRLGALYGYSSSATAFRLETNASPGRSATVASGINFTQPTTFCGRYGPAGAVSLSVNASAVVSSGTGTVPTGTSLGLGLAYYSNTTNQICGDIQKVNYWPLALTFGEVQAFAK